MGGLGSGRQWPYVKKTVEDAKELNIEYFYRRGDIVVAGPYGRLAWTNLISGKESSLRYGFEMDPNNLPDSYLKLWDIVGWTHNHWNYRIALTYTTPNFGGIRWWFLCPISKNGLMCNRRTGRLYLPRGEEYFGCRRCHDLTYSSSQESHMDTVWSRVAKKSGMTQRQAIQLFKEFFSCQQADQYSVSLTSHESGE